jgi:hypothetical protein
MATRVADDEMYLSVRRPANSLSGAAFSEISVFTLQRAVETQVEIKRPKMGQIGGQVAPFSTISYL